MAAVDVTTIIGEFVADAVETSIVLPHMTTGQRKAAKKLLEEYPEIRCESYGFGQERQLHLFKNAADEVEPVQAPVLAKSYDLPQVAVNVKNTFIDGWFEAEPEPIMFRSLPLRSDRRSLDFASIVKMSSQGDMEIVSPDRATTAAFSDFRKASAEREAIPACAGVALLQAEQNEIQVQNTFIHLKDASVDERIVQSMPNGMFRECVLAEISEGAMHYDTPTTMGYDSPRTGSESEVDEMCPLAEAQAEQSLGLSLGALVVVEGLKNAPAFNGRSAVVQGWDEAIGRYCILFADLDGCQQAKIKPENLRMVLPPLE